MRKSLVYLVGLLFVARIARTRWPAMAMVTAIMAAAQDNGSSGSSDYGRHISWMTEVRARAYSMVSEPRVGRRRRSHI